MVTIVKEHDRDLCGLRVFFFWTERVFVGGSTVMVYREAQWDSMLNLLDGDTFCVPNVFSISAARRAIAERSHGLIVRQVAHDRWEAVA